MALSKNRIKYIHSLELKKYRKAERVFLAEGPKLVEELLDHLPCRCLMATSEWLSMHQAPPLNDVTEVTEEELSRISLLKTPQQVLGVFEQPNEIINLDVCSHSLCLALDGIQDPGNLGTIVRVADWFGIREIFCSPDTVDIYNPKTVQATMGSIARVKVHYTPLPELILSLSNVPIYGTFLNGECIYTKTLSNHGLIIMGNEGKGISKEVERLVNERVLVPNYPLGEESSESLNVAIATSIVCAEFRRQAAWP